MDKPNERMRPMRKVKPQLDPSANDDSRAALQAAARNYRLVKDQWCDPTRLSERAYLTGNADSKFAKVGFHQ